MFLFYKMHLHLHVKCVFIADFFTFDSNVYRVEIFYRKFIYIKSIRSTLRSNIRKLFRLVAIILNNSLKVGTCVTYIIKVVLIRVGHYLALLTP